MSSGQSFDKIKKKKQWTASIRVPQSFSSASAPHIRCPNSSGFGAVNTMCERLNLTDGGTDLVKNYAAATEESPDFNCTKAVPY